MIALAVVAGFSGPLQADLTIKTRETFGSDSRTRTEYYKGSLRRMDFEQNDTYSIGDTSTKRYKIVDPTKHEYYDSSPYRLAAMSSDQSQTLVIEIETRDTGEQRQMFGHTARYFITTEHRHTEYAGKPPSKRQEIVTDGWYVDLPPAVPNHSRVGAVAVLVDMPEGAPMPRLNVTRSGPTIPGVPVWERTGEHLMEVVELSDAPLDQSLFEVPSNYRRVIRPQPGDQLSWSDRLLLCWQEFQEWLINSF
jgi:hypothetical protein